MAKHTPRDWRRLVDALTALRDNPTETGERRNNAASILEKIRANPEAVDALRGTPSPPPPPRLTDLTWMEGDEFGL